MSPCINLGGAASDTSHKSDGNAPPTYKAPTGNTLKGQEHED